MTRVFSPCYAVLRSPRRPLTCDYASAAAQIRRNRDRCAWRPRLEAHPLARATGQLVAEAANYDPVHRAYHRLTWPKNLPVVAIVSSKTAFDTPSDAQLWKKAKAQFVQASPNRRFVEAESSHNVPTDRPDVVIKAVENVLNQAH